MNKKHCCRACEPDSGYDIEMIKIREEQEKNEIRIDEYFAKEAAKRSKKKS